MLQVATAAGYQNTWHL